MNGFDRLPALPLITHDPYFSVWLPGDLPTDAVPIHWAGQQKPLYGTVTEDGVTYRFLGKNGVRVAETTALEVTPTATRYTVKAGNTRLSVAFRSPLLPDDLDTLSTPITMVDFACASLDGKAHEVRVSLCVSDTLCCDGYSRPQIADFSFAFDGLNVTQVGQKQQKILCHSGDHITIDWGYLYVASREELSYTGRDIEWNWKLTADIGEKQTFLLIGYDDIASINYFGVPCRAWYARNGRTIMDALRDFAARHEELVSACDALDARVLKDADEVGGEDYRKIVSAAWRHCIAAHKLIATPEGEMAFLSKENDSNGCIGTVDVSYPSTPLMLRYCPELVNALCRPILRFAALPVWSRDYAPHDVGRYPQAIGQVYSLSDRFRLKPGEVSLPLYLYPADSGVYEERNQMPVEESGNMLVMLYAAIRFGADDSLARKNMDTLLRWARYLDEYGEDPGEQLCTDDFAGHLAHNVNLSAKAIMGAACCGKLLERFGDPEGAAKWTERAKQMTAGWLERVTKTEDTPLTFDGTGWSQKYNLVWDPVLDLGLLPEAFYAKETGSYLGRMGRYGLPLDSRASYTKSDWILWCAAMARDSETRSALIAPVARYLRETKTRVPFSDWYDTETGDYVEFIARSVQGGLFMPMLTCLK